MVEAAHVAEEVRTLGVAVAHYVAEDPDFVEGLVEVLFVVAYQLQTGSFLGE